MKLEQLQKIEINGYSFHFQDSGRGETAVFVHGSVSDIRTWQRPVSDLENDFRCIRYSRRFHWPNVPITKGDDYPMLRHVTDLEGLVDQFDGPIHLVGHSYGAFICLMAVIRAPERFRSAVLAEPPAITLYVSNQPRPQELFRLFFIDPVLAYAIIRFGVRGLMPASKAALRQDREAVINKFGPAVLGRQAFQELTGARRKQIDDNLILAEFTGSGFPDLDPDALRSVETPVLMLTGEHSPLMFRKLCLHLEKLLCNAELSVIPGASHNMHEDNTEAYIRIVRSFIRSHTAA